MVQKALKWFKGLYLPSKVWIVTGLIHALSILAMAIVMFSLSFTDSVKEDDKQRIRCYAIIFFTTVFFHIFYLFEGMYQENILELLAFITTGVVTLSFAIYRVALSNVGTTVDVYILLGVSSIATIMYIVLAIFVFREFGWFVYKTVSADTKLQKIYWNLTFFRTFLKLDYFFHAVCATLALFFFDIDYEYAIVIVAIVLLLGWVFWGHFATLKESYVATVLFLLASLITPPYIIFKLYRIYNPKVGGSVYPHMPREQAIIFASLTLACVICVWVTCIRAMVFYRKGLKERLTRTQLSEKSPLASGGPVLETKREKDAAVAAARAASGTGESKGRVVKKGRKRKTFHTAAKPENAAEDTIV